MRNVHVEAMPGLNRSRRRIGRFGSDASSRYNEGCMSQGGSHIETEVKLRVPDISQMRAKLQALGYSVLRPRVFEANALYDTRERELRSRGELIRVRRAGDVSVLTFKSGDVPGRHKRRQELE